MKSNHLQSLAPCVISRHYQSLNSDKRLSPFDGVCTCNKDTLDIEDATHAVIGFMTVKHKGAFLPSSCIHLHRMTLLFQYLLLFPSVFSSSFFVFLSVVFSYSPLLFLHLCIPTHGRVFMQRHLHELFMKFALRKKRHAVACF